jgi:hypothetical protein
MGERNRGSMPPPPHNPPPLGIRNKHRQIHPPFCVSAREKRLPDRMIFTGFRIRIRIRMDPH